MNSRIFLSQSDAKQIAEAAEREALKNNWMVSIAIVNDAGQLIFFSKMDGSTNASVDVSIAKAKHAANYRRDTKFHEELLIQRNHAVLSLPGFLPIEGGVLLTYRSIHVGAIGVSGVASKDDGQIAGAGVAFFNNSVQNDII